MKIFFPIILGYDLSIMFVRWEIWYDDVVSDVVLLSKSVSHPSKSQCSEPCSFDSNTNPFQFTVCYFCHRFPSADRFTVSRFFICFFFCSKKACTVHSKIGSHHGRKNQPASVDPRLRREGLRLPFFLFEYLLQPVFIRSFMKLGIYLYICFVFCLRKWLHFLFIVLPNCATQPL